MNKIVILFLLTISIYASPVEVSVINPMYNKENLTLAVDGIVVSKKTTIITARSSGILKLFTYDNARVNKGDKIASIVDKRRTKRLALLQKKLLLEEKQIASQNLKFHDVKEIYKLGVGSHNSYLSEELLLNQIQELYENSKTEYETLALEEKNALILASEDSSITNLLPQNSYVTYGMTLATLVTKDTMIKLFVDVNYAMQLKKEMKVKINSGSKNFDAVISHVLFQSSNNLVEVMVTSQRKLPLHSTVSAEISLKSLAGLTLPKESIVLVENHPAVYIVKNSIAHLVFVDIIEDRIDSVLIKNTIPKESKVVLKNAYMLHDNLKVDVK
jgi:multidrug efflux pump subunit AcrA (membrane-fusion protein)